MCLTGNRKEWLCLPAPAPRGSGSYTVMGCEWLAGELLVELAFWAVAG